QLFLMAAIRVHNPNLRSTARERRINYFASGRPGDTAPPILLRARSDLLGALSLAISHHPEIEELIFLRRHECAAIGRQTQVAIIVQVYRNPAHLTAGVRKLPELHGAPPPVARNHD